MPEGIKRSISNGRYGEAADALRNLVRREPSVAILVALADVTFQLGNLTEAKESALKADGGRSSGTRGAPYAGPRADSAG